ncbi:hypothetical protein CDCA_CDCA10G2989 [Cyanidium caldarium]|uniref:Helicase ATP-binding domain-containing protein n=1 Tax=Cyanidium caldarium TaxID=2771 RepID=A0AAV9IXF0_CYACA|nr:hypothetical protein CDCA_CDCA10G2989 [Cyanidium caldarium]
MPTSAEAARDGATLTLRGVSVTFPHRPYACQVTYMERVIEALQGGEHALLESPTGTGKTVCLLCATLAWRESLKAQLQLRARGVGVGAAVSRQLNEAVGVKHRIESVLESLARKNNRDDRLTQPDPTPLSALPGVPRIVYLSRTHSQLRQVVRELAATVYGRSAKTVVLASRQHLCVHPSVSKIDSAVQQNVRCSQLVRARRCEYYMNAETHFAEVPDTFYFRSEGEGEAGAGRGPRDIEDLVAYGRTHRQCPYFLSREAVHEAELVLMPYNYALDMRTRRSLGFACDGDVIILDEAHNLESVCCEQSSFDFTARDRALCASALRALAQQLQQAPAAVDERGKENAVSVDDVRLVHQLLAAIEQNVREAHTVDEATEAAPKPSSEFAAAARPVGGIRGRVYPGSLIQRFFHVPHFPRSLSADNAEAVLRSIDLFIRALSRARDTEAAPWRLTAAAAETDPSVSHLLTDELRQATRLSHPLLLQYVSALEKFSQVIATAFACDDAHIDRYFCICVHSPADVPSVDAEASDKSRPKAAPSWPQQQQQAIGSAFGDRSVGRRPGAPPLPSQTRRPYSTTPGATLSFWCVFAGWTMREHFAGAHSVLLTSGTLAPLDTLAVEMGLSFSVRLENAHVVDPARQVCAAVVCRGPRGVRLNGAYANRQNLEYLTDLGAALVNVARVSPDGMLVFFPSYGMLHRVVEQWQTPPPAANVASDRMVRTLWERLHACKPVLVEPRDATELGETLSTYQTLVQSGRGACLLAVCRGRLAEGLDFADQYGRTVVLIGLPFPSTTDPRVVLKRDLLERPPTSSATDAPSMSGPTWYVQQCMRAANQAIGRAIRHAGDYGAILLLDERYLSHRQQLPRWLRITTREMEATTSVSEAGSGIAALHQFGPVMSALTAFWRSEAVQRLNAGATGRGDDRASRPEAVRDAAPERKRHRGDIVEEDGLRPDEVLQELQAWVRPHHRREETVPDAAPRPEAPSTSARTHLKRWRAQLGTTAYTELVHLLRQYRRAAAQAPTPAHPSAALERVYRQLCAVLPDDEDRRHLRQLLGRTE